MRGERQSITIAWEDAQWFHEFMQVIFGESDRGAILAATACIDERLASLLHTFFELQSGSTPELKKLFHWLLWQDPMPPLGSTGIKNRLCRALDIIDDNTYTTINRLARIRNNHFAHFSKPATFSDPDIKKALAELFPHDHNPHKTVRKRQAPFVAKKKRLSNARLLFNECAIITVCVLAHKESKLIDPLDRNTPAAWTKRLHEQLARITSTHPTKPPNGKSKGVDPRRPQTDLPNAGK